MIPRRNETNVRSVNIKKHCPTTTRTEDGLTVPRTTPRKSRALPKRHDRRSRTHEDSTCPHPCPTSGVFCLRYTSKKRTGTSAAPVSLTFVNQSRQLFPWLQFGCSKRPSIWHDGDLENDSVVGNSEYTRIVRSGRQGDNDKKEITSSDELPARGPRTDVKQQHIRSL